MTVVVTHSTPSDASFSATGATAWDANHSLSGVGTMAGQDANNVAITGGSISGVSGLVTSVTGTAPVASSGGATPAISMAAATTSVSGYLTSTDWNTFNGKGSGSVTSVAGTGTVNGLSLSGTVTSSGSLTFGGTLDLSSPPAIGGTAAAAGTFTTLTSPTLKSLTGSVTTGISLETPLGAQATIIDIGDGTRPLRINGGSAAGAQSAGISAATGVLQLSTNTSTIGFYTGGRGSTSQLQVSHTASAVNYVNVTGAGAGNPPVISSQGATTPDLDLTLTPKGAGRVNITTSIKPKVNSTTSVTSPLAWNSTSYDEYALTALANALTISADANTAPADGQRMMFRFKDNGTAQTLTWTTGSARAFRVVGVTLPTTTVASKLLYVGCIYNSADSRWDAIAVGQEA